MIMKVSKQVDTTKAKTWKASIKFAVVSLSIKVHELIFKII
jgi:hypothetical protein